MPQALEHEPHVGLHGRLPDRGADGQDSLEERQERLALEKEMRHDRRSADSAS